MSWRESWVGEVWARGREGRSILKSEIPNIYSLFKQNIKSCNAKQRRQRRRTVKNNNRSN